MAINHDVHIGPSFGSYDKSVYSHDMDPGMSFNLLHTILLQLFVVQYWCNNLSSVICPEYLSFIGIDGL